MKLTTTSLRALGSLAALVLLCAVPAPAKKSDVIFELEDPRGDDHGAGALLYPLRTDFEKGDLDLLSLRARRKKGATLFEATFARPIRVPGREAVDDIGTQLDSVAREGFYTFNLDIYIDTDREPGSGGVSLLPGRLAELRPEDAWDLAIVLTPRPYAARSQLQRLMLGALEEEMEDGERAELKRRLPDQIADRVYFPTNVRVRGRTISFQVPDSFLRGPAEAGWGYVVAVSGSNLVQSLDLVAKVGLADPQTENLMVLPVSPGSWQNRFGGGRENEPLQPPLVDVVVPAGRSQEEILGDFSSRENRPVLLPAVVPAPAGD